MGRLQDRLDRIKAGFVEQAPAEALAVMAAATEQLRGSGILDRVARPGEAMPSFRLRDTEDREVGSTELLARGPLVITVYRGHW